MHQKVRAAPQLRVQHHIQRIETFLLSLSRNPSALKKSMLAKIGIKAYEKPRLLKVISSLFG